jgi:hypothetical protein
MARSSALLELVAKGDADQPLLENADITMFKTVYRRITNSAIEDITYGAVGNGKFNSIYDLSPDPDGDLMGPQWICIEIDPLEMQSNPMIWSQVNTQLTELGVDPSLFLTSTSVLVSGLQQIQQWNQETAQQYTQIVALLQPLLDNPNSDADTQLTNELNALQPTTPPIVPFASLLGILTSFTDYWLPTTLFTPPSDLLTAVQSMLPAPYGTYIPPTEKNPVVLPPVKEVTLRLTDLNEITLAFQVYLQATILADPIGEIALLNIISQYTERYQTLQTNYPSGTTLAQLINPVIPASMQNNDTYYAFQFILNNSGSGVSTITGSLLELVIARLTKELPLIPYYNATLVMNTVSSLNELYGNIVYTKVPGSAFQFLETDSTTGNLLNLDGNSQWNCFTIAYLQNFLLSTFYLNNDFNLTTQMTYIIDGVTQTTNLAQSSSYTQMINNAMVTYIQDQLDASLSGSSSIFNNLDFDTYIADFVDPWVSVGSGNNPLSIPYLNTKFDLSTYTNNADYEGTDISYLNGILLWISERFYQLLVQYTNDSTIMQGNTNYLGLLSSCRSCVIKHVAPYIFPLPFSQLAPQLNSTGAPQVTGYLFLKRQATTLVTIGNTWISVVNPQVLDPKWLRGSTFQQVFGITTAQWITFATGAYNTLVTLFNRYFVEIPDISAPNQLGPLPLIIPDATINLQMNVIAGPFQITEVGINPPANFGDPSVSNSSVSTTPVTINTIVAAPNAYEYLDNLACYWVALEQLQTANYYDLYANILLDPVNVKQQVGIFSGDLISICVNDITLNFTPEIQIPDNPSNLQLLLSANETTTELGPIILFLVGQIGVTMQTLQQDYTVYQNNVQLLSLVNYTPPLSLMFDTIQNIQAAFTAIAQPIYAANASVDQTILTNFFQSVETLCFTVGDVWQSVNQAVQDCQAPWTTVTILMNQVNTFIQQYSPINLVGNTSVWQSGTAQFSTTRDYLILLMNAIPDGLLVADRASVNLVTDLTDMLTTYTNQATLLNEVNVQIQQIITVANSSNAPLQYAWIQKLGHYILEWVELRISGETWETTSSDFMDSYHELMSPAGQDKNYAALIGDLPEVYALSSNPKGVVKLYIPLQNHFCTLSGLYHPKVSTPYSQVQFRCKTRDFSQLIQAPDLAYPIIRKRNGEIVRSNPRLRMQLMSRFVYLDRSERDWFAKSRLEYLYPYHEEHPVVIINQSNYDVDNGFELRTYFNHLCRAIVIQTRMYSMEKANLWHCTGWQGEWAPPINTDFRTPVTAATTATIGQITPLVRGYCIDTLEVVMNNVIRQEAMPGIYYNRCTTWRGWKRAPKNGVYAWNIALQPGNMQPSGTANLSKIDDLSFIIKLHPGVVNLLAQGDSVCVRLFAFNYGIKRCMSGLVGKAFQ